MRWRERLASWVPQAWRPLPVRPPGHAEWRFLWLTLLAALAPLPFLVSWPLASVALAGVVASGLLLRARRGVPSWVAFPAALALQAGLRATMLGGPVEAQATLSLFICLAVAKSLRLKSYADAQIMFVLSVACAGLTLLAGDAPGWLAWAALVLCAVLAQMLRWHLRVFSRSSLAGSLKSAARTGLQVLPFVFLLFYVLPRLARWREPAPAVMGVTGASDRLSPGQVSRLVSSERPAFRAVVEAPGLDALAGEDQLYWRGSTLNRSSGLTWFAEKPLDSRPAPRPRPECLARQTVHWQAQGLYALDSPRPDSYRGGNPYTVESDLCARPNEAPSRADTSVELAQSPALRAWVAELRRAARGSPRVAADWVLDYFRARGFRYTLDPGALPAEGEFEYFLFKSRAGFCEHFAAALATALRLAGLPARVVTGFRGGSFNSFGGYWRVTMADAHAWTEIWVAGEGWVRVDPAAAVGPAARRGAPWPYLREAGDWADALLFRAQAFGRRQGRISASVLWRAGGCLALALALLAAAAVWGARRLLRARRPSSLLRAEFEKLWLALEARGLRRAPNEGFESLRRRSRAALDDGSAEELDVVLRAYVRVRYGAETLPAFEILELSARARRLRRRLARPM